MNDLVGFGGLGSELKGGGDGGGGGAWVLERGGLGRLSLASYVIRLIAVGIK